MDDWLARISDFASALRFDDLPAEVVQIGKERLIDSIGCALGSLGLSEGCPPADVGLRVATRAKRPELAGRVIGSAEELSAESATFVNGCLIRYLDFNDTYPGHHPSDALAALLAVAPVVKASGADLIAAMIVSYEISIRLTKNGRFNKLGWDNGYATGVGAAAGVSHLIGLTRDELRNAIAIIGTANLPLRATRSGQLSMWKGAATAYAVRGAVFAAQLAADGMTGPEAPFTGRHGVMEQITGPIELDALPLAGGEFLTPKVKLKYWPLVHNMQPLVWAGIELRKLLDGREARSIEIYTGTSARRESGSEPANWDPRTRETADHSAPYILAYVLRNGTIGEEAFTPSEFLDETLRPIMKTIEVFADEAIDAIYPDTVRMRVVATDTLGTRHEVNVENPIGHEKNPMLRPDIDAKFSRNAGALLDDGQIDRALEVLWALDAHSSDEAINLVVADRAMTMVGAERN